MIPFVESHPRLVNEESPLVLTLAATAAAQPIVIDHTCTDHTRIPPAYVTAAKQTLRVGYGHTSHGSQLVTGLDAHAAFCGAGSVWAYPSSSWGLQPGVFLNDYWGNAFGGADLGHNGDLAWRDATIAGLAAAGNDRNVVIWSWCGGVSDNTIAGIDTYLNAMNALEAAYPNVVFVYMTGHLDGGGAAGNLHLRNEQIRAYCLANDKVLFDFADIESYDPDAAVNYLALFGTDGCEYDTDGDGNPWGDGNWATEWIASHPGHLVTQIAGVCGGCAHSETLNCTRKGAAGLRAPRPVRCSVERHRGVGEPHGGSLGGRPVAGRAGQPRAQRRHGDQFPGMACAGQQRGPLPRHRWDRRHRRAE
jgi:hypothetical protein